MGLFKRKAAPEPAEPTAEELAAALAQKPGTEACAEIGCTSMLGLPCEYVDRRDRQCRTAWCPDHRAVVDLHVYCRRHAGIVGALPAGDTSVTMPMPDLENRAPSLVAWVARQVDSDVWQMMLHELEAAGGGQLIADPVTLVFVGVDRQRAWERAWKLATHEGEKRRVSLVVEEANDNEVAVRVGANIVMRLLPPWIGHRMRHERVSAEQDEMEREAFNRAVLQAVEQGLAHERALAQRLSRSQGTPRLELNAPEA